MNTPEIRFVGDLQRVDIKDGDTLVLSVDEYLSQEMADRLKKQVEQQFPGHNVVVLSQGIKLGVVGKEAA